jgi:hypothetical protein
MWEPLHEFTFDADARDVFVYILGPERQRPRRIVLTNHAYWFVCEFRATTHGAALYAVALHARLYGAKAGSKPGNLGRAPWDQKLILRGRANPTPVAEGEVGRIALLQRRPSHCRAKLYLAQDWQGQTWQYEDVKGELVDMTGVTFLVAVWRDLLEEWIEGRMAESEKSPWGDWSPNAEDIALLRDVIEDRRHRAQEALEQGAEASKPGKARHDDTAAIRALLEAWVEKQIKERTPAGASWQPLSDDADTRHLNQQLVQSQSRYETLSKRIAALDKDLARTLDSEHNLTLQERRRDLVAEWDQVAKEMARIEQQLGS